jgi:signal transduction histidine kinase
MTALAQATQTDGVVSVTVERLLPNALLVRLEDGRQGRIRQRELSWRRDETHNWQAEYRLGQKIDAVFLPSEPGEPLELSLRLVYADPWQTLHERYRIGQIVTGVVTGLAEDGVFVEIEPGVSALLQSSALPAWITQPITELFWIGDWVRAELKRIDPEKREIGLDLQNLAQHRWAQQGRNAALPRTADVVQFALPLVREELRPLTLSAVHRPSLSILLVEDDEQQNQAIARWLQSMGQKVVTASSAEAAWELLAASPPELLLSDVGLPGADGIDFVGRVLAAYPQIRCVLMTDWVTADSRSAEIAKLEVQGTRLLLKPLEPDDLGVILTRNAMPAFFSNERRLSQALLSGAVSSNSGAMQDRVRQVLDELRMNTQARQAILFQLDPYQRQIQIVAASGREKIKAQAMAHLLHSPVRDVIEDRITVHVEDSQEMDAYVRYLTPLLSFRSCLGVPVTTNLDYGYACFLFSGQEHAFLLADEKIATTGALALGALLEQQATLARISEMQRTLLVGHLSRALVHEANHQLSPIIFALEDLQSQCNRVDRAISDPEGNPRQEMEDTRSSLQSLSLSLQNLIRTTRMFGRITVQDDVRTVRVDRVLGRCMELLEDMADRAHIILEYEPDQILVTKVKETLIQQILLNLLLNAIQQIERTRPEAGGRIRAQINKINIEEGHYIQIIIEDDGPGIHRTLWRRIFDLGMTTRKDEGSGLGLYLAKHLCEEIRGRIYVDDSAMLWGTRFVVRIPVNL